MTINFATSSRQTALEYIQKVYPSKEIKEVDINKLLSLVENGILRVQDPLMYGNRIAVIAGDKFSEDSRVAINEAILQLKENKIL